MYESAVLALYVVFSAVNINCYYGKLRTELVPCEFRAYFLFRTIFFMMP